MIVRSDQLCCYIEGVKIPILEFESRYSRNRLSDASITIPISGMIIPKMWANAFVQITYIANIDGTRQEKLLFQGICTNLIINEDRNNIKVDANSVWDSLNLNTTLDYTSPRRYGLQRLEDGVVIYVGTEETISPELKTGYRLSERYYYLDDALKIDEIELDSGEARKLRFIATRTPFAERYAFSLFEDIGYDNFLLSKSYMDRFNLLAKSKRTSEKEEVDFMLNNIIGIK